MDKKENSVKVNDGEIIRRRSVINNHRTSRVDTFDYLNIWEQILNEENVIPVKKQDYNGGLKRIDDFLDCFVEEVVEIVNSSNLGQMRRTNSIRGSHRKGILGMMVEECNDEILNTKKIKIVANSKISPEELLNRNETSNILSITSEKHTKPRIVGVILVKMGSSMSSSAGDRRTNALRRSQRKSITGACSGVDKVLKVIKKFKGIEDSEEYRNIMVRIMQIEKNLRDKVGEIQPQFKTIHSITEEKINTAYELLKQKAKENEEAMPKSIILNGNMTPPSPNTRRQIEEFRTAEHEKSKEATSDGFTPADENNATPEATPAQSPSNEHKRNSLLLRLSKLTMPKRESTKSSSSEAEVTEVTAEVHKSPEATRKSIMKYGVPVLPSPTTSGRPRLVSFNTPDDAETTLEKHERRLKIIKQDIANLEIRISEFVGKKDGKHYNNLKSALKQLVEELEGIHEEELLDQVVQCHNYIKSCFNFLDTKAVDADDSDDDQFTNYTDSRIYGSTHDLLEGHAVRTTAI